MSELLKCFIFLAENVPTWLKTLEGLEEKVKARQREVERISVEPTSSRKLKKTGSSESIRPSGDDTENAAIDTVQSAPAVQQPQHNATGSSKRKRITSSALSVTSNSQQKSRTQRTSMIVYYDSEVQKAFEQLVHNIGSGRNHIRKARLAIRMEALTGTGATVRGAEEDINALRFARSARNGNGNGYDHLLAKGLRSSRGLDTLRPDPVTIDADGYTSSSPMTVTTDLCTLADQGLDKAQAFCETGAYHFLREGECDEEILGARNIFGEIKKTSDTEVERLTTVELERQRERDKERVKEQERHSQSRADVAAHPALMSGDGMNEVIEADDDDEEDDYALLTPPIRMMART